MLRDAKGASTFRGTTMTRNTTLFVTLSLAAAIGVPAPSARADGRTASCDIRKWRFVPRESGKVDRPRIRTRDVAESHVDDLFALDGDGGARPELAAGTVEQVGVVKYNGRCHTRNSCRRLAGNHCVSRGSR